MRCVSVVTNTQGLGVSSGHTRGCDTEARHAPSNTAQGELAWRCEIEDRKVVADAVKDSVRDGKVLVCSVAARRDDACLLYTSDAADE